MARPHIEFVQSQELPWAGIPWNWPGEAVSVKMLSEDDGNGACSAILRYPAGWRHDTPGWLDANEEFLVLEGELSINDEVYARDCYAYLPAGFTREVTASESGAVVLTFFDKAPVFTAGSGSYDESALVLKRDAFEMKWECEGMDPVYAEVGLRWKMFRHDPATKDTTMLIYVPPHMHPEDWKGPQERHDCVEEMFLIDGDFLSNVGLMCEGAYFWRPPGIAHGPYGTRSGNLTLIRTLGHDLVNNWTEHEVSISREPEYKPFLPETLAPLRERQWQRPPRY